MQANPSSRFRGQRDSKTLQRALLALSLYEFPTHLERRKLGWQIATGGRLEAAIQELVAVQLLFREGDALLPTIAARHFDWLELP